MKTITFDEAVYKLVPVDPTWEITVAAHGADRTLVAAYAAMLAAVPDDLPGVVEHSGEPCAWFEKSSNFKDTWFLVYKPNTIAETKPLFDHPPAQPDTTALQARIAELDAENITAHRKLAASDLDAKTAWGRYENANKCRIVTESQLAANTGCTYPLCQSEKEQDKVAEDIHKALYVAPPILAGLTDLQKAAPELLAALQTLVENGGIGPESMFHDARYAIKKATGNQS